MKGKNPADRAWLAARIKALNADVVCAQEVEDQDALDAFCRDDLEAIGVSYPYRNVVEGNDPRRIDVAVLSRLPLGRVSSRFWPDPAGHGQVFSRDLLQVEVLTDGRPLQLFINHLKSNFIPDEFTLDDAERAAARSQVLARRRRQAQAVTDILRRQRLTRRIVVLGDMNDHPGSEALAALVEAGLVEQVGAATILSGPTRRGVMVADRFADLADHVWTHRYRSPAGAQFSLYDQIWTSPDLADAVIGSWVMRRTQITGDATDHDPAILELDL